MAEPQLPELQIPAPKINWEAVSKWVVALLAILRTLFGIVPVPPIARRLWVITLRETSDLTPAQANIVFSDLVANVMQSKKHHWRCCDPDGKDREGKVPPGIQPYLDLAQGRALPMLFLVAADNGDLMYASDFPASATDFADLLTIIGG